MTETSLEDILVANWMEGKYIRLLNIMVPTRIRSGWLKNRNKKGEPGEHT
jgi:hypothetical protein